STAAGKSAPASIASGGQRNISLFRVLLNPPREQGRQELGDARPPGGTQLRLAGDIGQCRREARLPRLARRRHGKGDWDEVVHIGPFPRGYGPANAMPRRSK